MVTVTIFQGRKMKSLIALMSLALAAGSAFAQKTVLRF